MVACVDAQREMYGGESICEHLPIAPATYWDENEQIYGAEKVWRQLRREHIPAARCTSNGP